MVPLIDATAEPGMGVLVQFGARMTGDILSTGSDTDWFDNIMIHDPGATGAYFYMAGNYTTPLDTFYDTELVFGGEGVGEATSFTRLRADLGPFYANDNYHGRDFNDFPLEQQWWRDSRPPVPSGHRRCLRRLDSALLFNREKALA